MGNIELKTNTAISDKNIRRSLRIPEINYNNPLLKSGDWQQVIVYLNGIAWKNAIDPTRSPRVYYYHGKYNRTYYLWITDPSNGINSYMFYYDHSTGLISDHYQVTSPIANATDVHGAGAFIITDNGIIITACEELQGTASMAHNSEINIYVSANPEDPSSIDSSTPTTIIGTGGEEDSYSYPALEKLPNGRILLYLRQGLSSSNHHKRALFYSDDEGSTWDSINPSLPNGDFITLDDADLWAYGFFLHSHRDFVAIHVKEQDKSQAENVDISEYLLLSKDGETWGNIEWLLNISGSWSVDATSHLITRGELIANCLIAGEGAALGTQTYNVALNDMTFDDYGFPYFIYKNWGGASDIEYFTYYDEDTGWVRIDLTAALPYTPTNHGALKVLDDQGYVIDLVICVTETNAEVVHFRTYDKGQNWTEIEKLTSLSGLDHTYLDVASNVLSNNVMSLAANLSDGTNADLAIFLSDAAVDQTGNKILKGQTLDTGVSAGDLVVWSGASWVQADADASSTTEGLLGIVFGTNDVMAIGVFYAKYYYTAGLTAGDTYYVSPTAGQITNTKPTATGQCVRVIGYAYDSRNLIFDPSHTYIEIS